MAIALTGRLQYIPQPSKYSSYAATGAISVLAKFIMYTQQSQLRFFGAGVLGGGEGVRFNVFPNSGASCPAGSSAECTSDFKDTVRAGVALAGLGGGLYYEAAKSISLVVEVDVLAGFPQFGVIADGNLFLQYNIY